MPVNKLMKFFSYAHLPVHLRETSRMFCELATNIDNALQESAEKTVCLRKLLESKDCAVRAVLDMEDNQGGVVSDPDPNR